MTETDLFAARGVTNHDVREAWKTFIPIQTHLQHDSEPTSSGSLEGGRNDQEELLRKRVPETVT